MICAALLGKGTMATYVLVAGAFHGAWAWKAVDRTLSEKGHHVFAVDLTGQGTKLDSVTPDTDLSTHIRDVVEVIERNELTEVILVGHSYSGMVVTGVVDLVRERIAELVYADAMVPVDGQSAEDFSGPEVTKVALESAGGHWLVNNFFPICKFGPFRNAQEQATFTARLVPHPMKTFFEKLNLQQPPFPRRTFISSTLDPVQLFTAIAGHAKHSAEWEYHEIPTGHDAMLTEPAHMAEILDGISGKKRHDTSNT